MNKWISDIRRNWWEERDSSHLYLLFSFCHREVAQKNSSGVMKRNFHLLIREETPKLQPYRQKIFYSIQAPRGLYTGGCVWKKRWGKECRGLLHGTPAGPSIYEAVLLLCHCRVDAGRVWGYWISILRWDWRWVQFHSGPKYFLSVKASINYVNEEYTDDTDKDYPGGQAFAKFEYTFTENNGFSQSVEFLNDFTIAKITMWIQRQQ